MAEFSLKEEDEEVRVSKDWNTKEVTSAESLVKSEPEDTNHSNSTGSPGGHSFEFISTGTIKQEPLPETSSDEEDLKPEVQVNIEETGPTQAHNGYEAAVPSTSREFCLTRPLSTVNPNCSFGESHDAVPTTSQESNLEVDQFGRVAEDSPKSVTRNIDASQPDDTSHTLMRTQRASTLKRRNESRDNRARGIGYIDRKGVLRAGRKVKPGCNAQCKFKCHSNISKDNRLKLYNNFYLLGDVNVQRQYVSSRIELKPVESRAGVKGKKTCSRNFTVQVNNNTFRVCKTFFLDTFSISNTFLETSLKKRRSCGTVIRDLRGSHQPQSNLMDVDKDSI